MTLEFIGTLEDALDYGRTLLPLTRRLLAERTQHQTAAE